MARTCPGCDLNLLILISVWSPLVVVLDPHVVCVAITKRNVTRGRVALHPFHGLDAEQVESPGQGGRRVPAEQEPVVSELAVEDRAAFVEAHEGRREIVEIGA